MRDRVCITMEWVFLFLRDGQQPRRPVGRAILAAMAFAAILLAPSAAQATPGVCDTIGPIEVEATSGPSLLATYPTLRDAFNAINGNASPVLLPQHQGTITIDVCGDSIDTRTAILKRSGFIASTGFPPSSYTSVTISPVGARTIAISGSVNPNNATIDLDGADNVTIDGLNSGGNSLTITSSVASLGTLKLWNDATGNVIRNCSILNSGGDAGPLGIINITNGISVGNINNTFQGNTIGSTGATMAVYALRNDGNTVPNTGINILNNNFYDYSGRGIYIPTGGGSWNITGNRFYLTRTGQCGDAATGVKAIDIVDGGGYTISSNVIGYASAAGTGTASYSGGGGCVVAGIYLLGASTPASSIQGNTITAISMSTSSNGSGLSGAIFAGIFTNSSNVDIGTTAGNTIGAATGTGAISMTQSFPNGSNAYGIWISTGSPGTMNIRNNTVGSMSINGTVLGTYNIRGIRVSGGSLALDVSANLIGSLTTPDSILATSAVPAGSATSIVGLYLDPGSLVTSATINDNVVRNTTSTGTFVTQTLAGIYLQSASSPGVALSFLRNSIISNTHAGGVFSPFYGILQTAAVGSVAINDNVIRNCTITGSSSGVRGIYQQGAVTGAIDILRNQLGNNAGGFVDTTSSTASTGEIDGIYNLAATPTSVLTIEDNDIRGITYTTPAGDAPHYYVRNTVQALSQHISRNTFTNLSVATAGDVFFIANNAQLPAGGSAVINDNRIVTGFSKTVGGGTVWAYFATNGSSAAGTTRSAQRNDFSNISLTGATTMNGWTDSEGVFSPAGGPTKTISDNVFRNWTNPGGAVEVIRVDRTGSGSVVSNNDIATISAGGTLTGIAAGNGGGGTSLSISSNRITGLSSTGAGAIASGISGGSGFITTLNVAGNKVGNLSSSTSTGQSIGIAVSASQNFNVYDNIVGDLTAPAANAANPVVGISVQGGTTANVDFNTVRLAASSSGATFGSSAVSVDTTPTVTLRNNIFANLSTQNGSGLAVAYRRSNPTLSTYGAASNNNDFVGARIYTDGSSTDTLLAAYKTRVASRDSASVSESPTVLSTTAADPDFLHLNPTVTTLLESGGIPVAGIAGDYDGDPRHASQPDIGADEIVGRADLRVTRSDTPDPVGFNQSISYGITVTNDGPHKAWDVSLSDATPAGTTLVSFTPAAGWSCSAPSPGAAGSISCTAPSLAIGASASFTLVVHVGECAENGTVIPGTTTVAAASTIDPNNSNNTALSSTTTTGTPITCTPDAQTCTLDVCIAGQCQHPLAPEFTPCGDPNNTLCNAPDSCNTTGTCVDRKKSAGTVCLAGTGPCDENDVCDGTTNACAVVLGPNYVPTTSCFLPGVCAAGNVASHCSGAVEVPCATGSPTGADGNCNNIDENCDGTVDGGYVSQSTSCGVGACASTGSTSCVSGTVMNSCAPGTPAASDATCNNIDEDCNGTADEDYVSVATSCGVGACASAGSTSCAGGLVTDSCTPGTAAASDTTCDGNDDDCDGSLDEDYVPAPTSCGVGACASTGTTWCAGGTVLDSCAAGTPAGSDATCDGVDDDCDGSLDENYVPAPTSCGVGACASTGSTSCVGGTVLNSCAPGTPAANDATCNGIDDDCDGSLDENYVPVPTSCGVGACASTGSTSCVGGTVLNSCAPGTPVANDATCNGIDDDCDGSLDENYVPVPTSCGVGACASTGSTSCVGGTVLNSCAPGTPAANDATCNGIDDDCDGSLDENYVPAPTSCGIGACASTGSTSCVGGTVLNSCAPGTPAASDTTCNGIDEDCSGTADEDFVPSPTACGVGQCARTGSLTCVGGAILNTCTPGLPSPEICDGLDNDCDGTADTGGGGPEVCDGFDNDCDGIIDDDLSIVTVTAIRNIVGQGNKPTTRTEPIVGLLVNVYDWSPAGCAKTLCNGSNQTSFACIYQRCGPMPTGSTPDPARTVTNASGVATFRMPPGTYIVLGGNGSGQFLSEHLGLTCGGTQTRNLQEIVNSRGESIAAQETVRTGSRLTIVEPQEVVWNESEEFYPFIFVAEGDWAEEASVEPPEGFVSDYNSLSALAWDGTTSAVQFTLTDVGSDWVPTRVRHELLHNQRREVVVGEVDVRLESSFAMAKGLDTWGRALRVDGPQPDPIPMDPSGRLEGWIEGGAIDPLWVFKVETYRPTFVSLFLENANGDLLFTITEHTSLEEGHHAFLWDREALDGATPLDGLRVRIVTENMDEVYPLRRHVPPPGVPRLPEITLHGGE